jgi:HTH-type transcriptional regulator/antitoxin HigA
MSGRQQEPDVQPLRSVAEYEAALAEYESYFDREPLADTEAARRFQMLGSLLAAYEEEQYSLEPNTPRL